MLKVDVGQTLPYLRWGNSDALEVADPVLAIGNPLGIGMSVSTGVVSALNRDLQDTPFDSYIQTDAAINHGNSGGPLINQAGEVVGIDTALYNPDQKGGFIGIGFAIPSSTAKFVVGRLLDPSHPKPAWLGVTLDDMTQELAKALGLPQSTGAIISEVDPTGPGGPSLRPGDVLEALDGVRLNDFARLHAGDCHDGDRTSRAPDGLARRQATGDHRDSRRMATSRAWRGNGESESCGWGDLKCA